MDPLGGQTVRGLRGFPRTRGDGPGGRGFQGALKAFPPHARGWTGDLVDSARQTCIRWFPPHARGWTLLIEGLSWSGYSIVSPARAGMDLGHTGFTNTVLTLQFPPHARGWTPCGSGLSTLLQVSTARAGMDRGRALSCCRPRRFPRTRGDGPTSPAASVLIDALRGFPRTRGDGPARMPSRTPPSPCRFPRTRGDGPGVANRMISYFSPFPPHARGWTVSYYAAPVHSQSGFPRTRGDGPRPYRARDYLARFPPHARGWTGPVQFDRQDQIVSPARAGMDPPAAS